MLHIKEITMNICGLQKLSMVDYPGKLAATVFTGGCNLRCPFCHNALLVTRLSESPRLETDEVLSFLKSRQGLLDAVVLSGGEPLLQVGAADFLAAVKNMGYLVKLDTNGCYPTALAEILAQNMVDYVAMDIKNSRKKYASTVGIPGFDIAPVLESIRLIQKSGVDYEFRTTAVQQFHTAEDFAAIGAWLHGSKNYYIQNFVDSGNLIGTGLTGFSKEELESFAFSLTGDFEFIGIRGI